MVWLYKYTHFIISFLWDLWWEYTHGICHHLAYFSLVKFFEFTLRLGSLYHPSLFSFANVQKWQFYIGILTINHSDSFFLQLSIHKLTGCFQRHLPIREVQRSDPRHQLPLPSLHFSEPWFLHSPCGVTTSHRERRSPPSHDYFRLQKAASKRTLPVSCEVFDERQCLLQHDARRLDFRRWRRLLGKRCGYSDWKREWVTDWCCGQLHGRLKRFFQLLTLLFTKILDITKIGSVSICAHPKIGHKFSVETTKMTICNTKRRYLLLRNALSEMGYP